MKIINFSELTNYNFALSEISVIYQTPIWNNLIMSSADNGRKLNGFLLIDKGACHYTWASGEATLEPGSLVYLPKGSAHTVKVLRRDFSFYRLSFVITDAASGEQLVFGNCPNVLTNSAGRKLFELCAEMQKTTLSKNNIYKSTALLCEFFAALSKLESKSAPGTRGRASAAVEYIEKNYTLCTDVKTLAEMCFMSEPHFFRIFRKEIGTTPINYRNRLRTEHAKALLSDGELSISEISSLLGFESLYYFSRSFKRETGVSPSTFQKEHT